MARPGLQPSTACKARFTSARASSRRCWWSIHGFLPRVQPHHGDFDDAVPIRVRTGSLQVQGAQGALQAQVLERGRSPPRKQTTQPLSRGWGFEGGLPHQRPGRGKAAGAVEPVTARVRRVANSPPSPGTMPVLARGGRAAMTVRGLTGSSWMMTRKRRIFRYGTSCIDPYRSG